MHAPSQASARFFIAFRSLLRPNCRTSCADLPKRPFTALRLNHAPPGRAFSTSKFARQQASSESQTESFHTQHQTLTSRTHYDLFPSSLPQGPPPQGPFNVDLASLRREFLQLQAKEHPDLHRGADKARAEGASAAINEAYKTLQNPLLRAQYLLRLRGIEVESEHEKLEDPELLGSVMEAREEIEEAESEEEVERLREPNELRTRESVRRLAEAFERDELEMARRECVRLRYWVNIRESLDAWEGGSVGALQH